MTLLSFFLLPFLKMFLILDKEKDVPVPLEEGTTTILIFYKHSKLFSFPKKEKKKRNLKNKSKLLNKRAFSKILKTTKTLRFQFEKLSTKVFTVDIHSFSPLT